MTREHRPHAPLAISPAGWKSLRQKEERFAVQQALLARHGPPLLSLSLRLPAELQPTPEGRALLAGAADPAAALCPPAGAKEIYTSPEGWQVIALTGDARRWKRAAAALEESSPAGVFLDLDVLGPGGRPMTRQKLHLPPRPCILCGGPAKHCHRAGTHPRSAVSAAFQLQLEDYFLGQPAGRAAQQAGETAVAAALLEVCAHPKPGLVSSRGCGAHRDMDLGTFILSSTALTGVFTALYNAGEKHSRPGRLFIEARAIGACGERKMFRATRGVNTQKGYLFVTGLILAALGAVGHQAGEKELRTLIRAMTRNLVRRELGQAAARPAGERSAGERAYCEQGLRGVRGEAEEGFPTVFEAALPAARAALAGGASLNDVALQALLAAMARAEDTTLVKRGGMTALHRAQNEAAAILAGGGMLTAKGRAALETLTDEFNRTGLSPGGAADLAAAALFFILRDDRHPARLWK